MDKHREIRVGIRQLRRSLTRYVNEARKGTSVLVTARAQVVAELRAPAAETRPARQLGRLKGKIWIADDVDNWPADIATSFEAGIEP